MQAVKRALLSVSDKKDIIFLASRLHALGVELLSTGGTSLALKEAGIPHRLVEEITGVQEMLGGRVKTLHPMIHGGILAEREAHAVEMQQHGISGIDLVVVNFYPFHRIIENTTLPLAEVIEEIDIGGPAMVRAAAKNMQWVGVVVDPTDYQAVIAHLENTQSLPLAFKQQLALKAFKMTAQYDTMVSNYLENRFNKKTENHVESLLLKESIALRYGENPHQRAKAFKLGDDVGGVLSATVYQGKALSFNNLLDADAALNCIAEFELPACVIVKHGNPCGVSVRASIIQAYQTALQADRQSAFGGVVALNQACDAHLAQLLSEHFFEVIIAPSYSDEALTILAGKPNLRVLALPSKSQSAWEYKFIDGGVLKQEKDRHMLVAADLKLVSKQAVPQDLVPDLLFAWQVIKHIKSNAILIARDQKTLGIGGGQVSRIDAVETAVKKAGSSVMGAVLASDAFFPFRDSIDRIAALGIRAIIQPGGSVKDQEVIAACDEHNIAMVFTGVRCFKH